MLCGKECEAKATQDRTHDLANSCYDIFNKDKIVAKTEQWTKEAEKAGMTLTEYLESISPLKEE